jgi:hypothetical protein
MRRRAFVLIPLAEIAPDLVFPDGERIAEALGKIRYTLKEDLIFQPDKDLCKLLPKGVFPCGSG